MSVVRKLSSFSLRNSSEYISNIFLSNKYVFKGKEEIVYKGGNKQTFLLNSVFKDVNSLGIIGWGPQAKAQACNLQDTFNLRNIDTKITIGLRNESKSIEKAKQAGFSTNTIENVSKESDLLLFLVSDSAQATMYKSVLSNMKKGATLGLSHGFLLGHMKNNNDYFPKDINVIAMCPKGMGDSVRDLYLSNCGNSINSSICVEQVSPHNEYKYSLDLSDHSNIKRPIDLALGWAIGIGSPYIFTTSLQDEWISDLVGERAILLGGLFGIMQSIEILALQNNFPMEKMYNLTANYITGTISKKISKDGLLSVYNEMFQNNDINLKNDFRLAYCLSYETSKLLIEEIYQEVKSGNEIRSVVNTGKNNKNLVKSLSGNSLFWQANNLKNSNKCDKNDLINCTYTAKAVGMYIGSMMAQIDVLIENNHNYSEIVNESIIEAVDSLNPYMYKKGIDWMVDNCSVTARIGTRKWGPRFYSLYSNYVINNKMHTVPGEDHILFKKFIKHPIHNIFDMMRNINKN